MKGNFFVLPVGTPYNADVTAGEFRTFARIAERLWNAELDTAETSEPMTWAQAGTWLKMEKGQAWRHVNALVAAGLIELTRISDSVIQIRVKVETNSPVPTRGRVAQRAHATTTLLTIKDNDSDSESLKEEKKLARARDSHRVDALETDNMSVEEKRTFLRAWGVREPNQSKIAMNGQPVDWVRRHLEHNKANGNPINYAIRAMLDMTDPPAAEPCKRCGLTDGHREVLARNSKYGEYGRMPCEDAGKFSDVVPFDAHLYYEDENIGWVRIPGR